MNYKNNYIGFISTDMTEIKKGTYENPIFTTDDEYLIKLINITSEVKQLTENAADKL